MLELFNQIQEHQALSMLVTKLACMYAHTEKKNPPLTFSNSLILETM